MIVLFSAVLIICLFVTLITGETLKEAILRVVVEVIIVGLVIVDMIGGF